MDKDNLVYVEDICNAISKIEKYVFGYDEAKFVNDDKTRDAVIRQFEIIGEACRRLSKEFTESNSSLPWRKAMDLRNLLIHEYDYGLEVYKRRFAVV